MSTLNRESRSSSRKEKPKVLLLVPSLRFGGTERQVVEMALIAKERYSPVVCTIYPENRFPVLEEQGIRVVSLNKKTGILYNMPCFLKFLRLVRKEKPAIIHSFLMFANLYACGVGLLFRFKHIITSTRINIKLSTVLDFTKCYGGNKITYYLCRKFSRFHMVNTHYSADVLVNEVGYRRDQVRLIENMVDTERFANVQDERNMSWAVYPARIEARKNQLTLIEAIAILKQKGWLREGFQIFLVGEKNDKPYAERVSGDIRRNHLEEHILFIDPTSRIERYYSLCSFLVFPSSWEGLSNTILEAMACGLPVVCSKEANLPGLIEDGVNGYLFSAESPEACAESLHKMMNTEPLKRREMGQVNRQVIAKRFTRPILNKNLEALYESCLTGVTIG